LPLPQTPAPEGGSEEALEVPDAMIEGSSTAMRELMGQLRATVHSTLDVLLLGETGTGKELFARMVHASGPKREGPFVAINCAAIPSELLEAELFGVVGRVATGVDPRPGRFTQAGGGSIFLDEVGELPERLQAKLLRVLQEREVLPIGSSRPRKIDVRVISASNRDLARLVQERGFRADLYYRLRGLEFHIPPLRERREDLPELILTFASRASRKYRKRVQGVSRRALTQLMEYSWPGNVRELETEVERAVLLCPAGGTLESEHFGSIRWEEERQRSGSSGEIAVAAPASLGSSSEGTDAGAQAEPDRRPLKERVDELERAAIAEALATTGGNKTRAAELLGITRNGLSLKMKRLGLEVGRS
jgi:transcriptional regulator with PAS, ATPase and Fis domain